MSKLLIKVMKILIKSNHKHTSPVSINSNDSVIRIRKPFLNK